MNANDWASDENVRFFASTHFLGTLLGPTPGDFTSNCKSFKTCKICAYGDHNPVKLFTNPTGISEKLY